METLRGWRQFLLPQWDDVTDRVDLNRPPVLTNSRMSPHGGGSYVQNKTENIFKAFSKAFLIYCTSTQSM